MRGNGSSLPDSGVDPALVLTGSMVLCWCLYDAVEKEVAQDGADDEEEEDVDGGCVKHGLGSFGRMRRSSEGCFVE